MFGTDLLRTRAATTPDRVAVIELETDAEWTYRELDQAVDELAATLQTATEADEQNPALAVGLEPGISFVCTAHAAMRLGWELGALNTRLATSELATRLDRLDPNVVLCDSETEELISAAFREVYPKQSDSPLYTVDEPVTTRVRSLPETSSEVETEPLGPDSTALVLFTSGTTGNPKGVRLTSRNLIASATESAFRLGVSPADRWLCCLPMYHMGGLSPVYRSPLYGTTIIIQQEFDAVETAKALDSRGITGVSLVPTQLSRLLDVGLSASQLETVLLGGAPASESLLERAGEADIPTYPTYGLTEAASQVATARPQEHRSHPGTVGQPLFGTTVQVLDDNGQPVEAGNRGEIVVDGPTVTPGYLDDEQTNAAFSERGLHTGDFGYRDEDGRLWVLGRLDDTIITGGELVAPATVVETIESLPEVSEAAVVGIEDEEWGERVAALVVPSTARETDVDQLKERVSEHCRERLAGYKTPREIRVVDSLPRTHSGTIDRERARELLRSAG